MSNLLMRKSTVEAGRPSFLAAPSRLAEAVLIAELAETAEIRASASCRSDGAKALGKYVSAHKNSLNAIKTIALNHARRKDKMLLRI
jgi:hypothetical protein